MGMRARLGLGIARDLKQHMNKFMRYESSCSAEEKRLYLYFEEVTSDERLITTRRFPIRSVKLSYLLSPSSTKINKADDFVPVLRERQPRGLGECRRRRWGGTFITGQLLFSAPAPAPGGGSSSYASAIQSCSLRSKGKLNKNLPVIKRIKKNKSELLFLEGQVLEDGKLYTVTYSFFDRSNSNVLQVLDTNGGGRKPKWVSLEGPPPLGSGCPLIFCCVVCNNKVLLWYPNKERAYCFDVTQPERGWSSAPPSWARCIPFLTCYWPLLVEHEHDYLLLFTFDPNHIIDGQAHDCKIKVFLISHQCDTFEYLNQPLQLPEVPDMPSYFWDWRNPCISPLDYHFVHLGGQKICLVLHRLFYNDSHIGNNTVPVCGRDKARGILFS